VTGRPYTAYSYLPAAAFPRFELAPEFGRVAPYPAGLTPGQERRARALLRDSLVISLHDHPVRFPARMEQTPGYNRTGRQHTAYAGRGDPGRARRQHLPGAGERLDRVTPPWRRETPGGVRPSPPGAGR
jgi:membrane dipeptidase